MRLCDSYLEDEADVKELWDSIDSSCGCSYTNPICRDLNIVPISNPISWRYRLTCKKTATVVCKTSVNEVTKIWKKVPTKNDKVVCYSLYEEIKLWATSCN